MASQWLDAASELPLVFSWQRFAVVVGLVCLGCFACRRYALSTVADRSARLWAGWKLRCRFVMFSGDEAGRDLTFACAAAAA